MPFNEHLKLVNQVKVEHLRPNLLGRILLFLNPKTDLSKVPMRIASRQYLVPNLVTNAGRNWLTGIMGSAAGTPAKYIAITADTGAPAAGDTTLASEYVAFGLSRAAGTYAHTADTDSFTLEYTWTATADSKVVAKTALFDAATVGNMFAEVLLGSSVTLMTNDQLKITWTVDLGL